MASAKKAETFLRLDDAVFSVARAFSMRYAFERQDVIDLDAFTPHRLLYWMGMQSNSFEIRARALQMQQMRSYCDRFLV